MATGRRWQIVATIGLAAVALTACKSSSGSSGSIGSKSSLVIGFSYSSTGSLANEGKLMHDGYQLWADTVNSKGGLKVGGKSLKVQLKSYDDESNANNAASNTQKLITDDKVDFVLGPYGSANTLAAETVAEKNKYVFLDAEGAANEIFAKNYKYVVANVPLATTYPTQAMNFLAAQTPKPKLAVIWADDAFSKTVGQAAVDQAKQKGLDVVVSQQYPAGNKDFSTLITQMKSGGAQAVFAAGHADEALQVVKQEQQLDFHPGATIQTVGPTTPSFVTALGTAAENQYGTASWTSTIGAFKDDLFGSASTYAANYKKAFGQDPDYHSAGSSAGAEILGLGIQKANSLDQDKVLTALKSLDVMTVGGPFKANADGSNANGIILLGQVQGGQFVSVFPDKYAFKKPLYPVK